MFTITADDHNSSFGTKESVAPNVLDARAVDLERPHTARTESTVSELAPERNRNPDRQWAELLQRDQI